MKVKKNNWLRICGFVVVSLFTLFIACDDHAIYLDWPQITNQSKPWTRWWWMGSIVDKENLTTAMEEYEKAGLGGLEITPIYGVRGYEDRFINYLSPEWVEMLVHTLQEAERLGMGIDMATGTGWPFGGPSVGADDACKNIVFRTDTLSGGESLSEPISYMQTAMIRAIGQSPDSIEMVEPISANKDLQSLALEQVRFEKPLPLQVLTAYSDSGQTLNLTDRVNEDGILEWVAPAGDWILYSLFQGWHGKMVERAGPGGEGNVIDHFSSEALMNYLSEFDQAYASQNLSSLRAYFNDSYEVDDASGESNWTPDFFEEFQKRRGYDLRNYLPALFGNDSVENNIRVLCDYRETISDLLLEEFTVPWREWAKSKGAIIRNQAHGSPANILDLYAASDIPETEGSDILGFKFASSAAHVTGQPLTSSESATWLNEHFLTSLADVKQALDQFFLGGVNHVFYHGTTFSPVEENWPGWMFYASVHFGPTNSFWSDFSALNRYVARCQSFLQASQPDNDILLYFPFYDRLSQPGRSMLQHFRGGGSGTTARTCAMILLNRGYSFDFISDRQLENVKVVDATLQVADASYKTVVLPECRYIPVETFKKLVSLARGGATIIVHQSFPSDVPGLGHYAERREALTNLFNSMTFTEVGTAGIKVAAIGNGAILQGPDLEQLLSYAGINRETMVDYGLIFIRSRHDNNRYYFIVNPSIQDFDGWIPLQTRAKSVAIFNPMLEENGLAGLRTSESGMNEVYLQLAPGESCILKTFDTVLRAPSYRYIVAKGDPQEIVGTWSVNFVEGGPELPASIQTTELDSWTYYSGMPVKAFSGSAWYTISFPKPEEIAGGFLLDLGRVCESALVRLNGRELGTLIGPSYEILIPDGLLGEENFLEIRVSNLMANRIADLDRRKVNWKKFYNTNFPARMRDNRNSDGQFTASHWLPRESGLIGPVLLIPIEVVEFPKVVM